MFERSKSKCKIPANVSVGYVIDEKQGINKISDKAFQVELGDKITITYTNSDDIKVTETLKVSGIIECTEKYYYQIFLDSHTTTMNYTAAINSGYNIINVR